MQRLPPGAKWTNCTLARQRRTVGGRYLRMLTALAATITASRRLATDSTSISIFAQRLSGIVSVGLNAVAFVNETYR